jgi:hypothetical protein
MNATPSGTQSHALSVPVTWINAYQLLPPASTIGLQTAGMTRPNRPLRISPAGMMASTYPTVGSTIIHSRSRQVAGSVSSRPEACPNRRQVPVRGSGSGYTRYGVGIGTRHHSPDSRLVTLAASQEGFRDFAECRTKIDELPSVYLKRLHYDTVTFSPPTDLAQILITPGVQEAPASPGATLARGDRVGRVERHAAHGVLIPSRRGPPTASVAAGRAGAQ